MVKKTDLFTFKNTVNAVSKTDEAQLSNYLDSIKAFARITYSSIYVIDYYRKDFDYVSQNPLFLCGLSSEEVRSMGYGFYFKYVAEQDVELLDIINKVGFEFYDTIPPDKRLSYSISYDFHLQNDKGNIFLVNHKLTPIFLTETGKIWKAICIISLSNNKESGNIYIYEQNENRCWHYNLQGEFWEIKERIILSEREREILLLSIQGYTINEVAEKLYVTASTIKFHRRNLFDKLGVSNMAEALAFATNNKLRLDK